MPYGFTETQRLGDRGGHYLEVMARLRPGIPLAAANEEIEQLSMRIAEMHPDNYPPEMKSVLHVEPLRERFVASSRQPILVLFGAVLLVLLIACGNVANLLLARSAVREREFAVRSALGAERSRIVRQLLTEGLLLSALGAFLGVLLATWGLDVLLAVAPRQIRQVGEVRIDRAVLAFSAGLTIATTLVFALVPALRASRVDLASSLKEGGRGSAGAPGARLRRVLVIAQVALCLFLLVGAGLLIRSFAQILRVSPGFDPEGAIAADLIPAGSACADPDARERYFRRERSSCFPPAENGGRPSRSRATSGRRESRCPPTNSARCCRDTLPPWVSAWSPAAIFPRQTTRRRRWSCWSTRPGREGIFPER